MTVRFYIAVEAVDSPLLRLRFVVPDAECPVTAFFYWLYQPTGAAGP